MFSTPEPYQACSFTRKSLGTREGTVHITPGYCIQLTAKRFLNEIFLMVLVYTAVALCSHLYSIPQYSLENMSTL